MDLLLTDLIECIEAGPQTQARIEASSNAQHNDTHLNKCPWFRFEQHLALGGAQAGQQEAATADLQRHPDGTPPLALHHHRRRRLGLCRVRSARRGVARRLPRQKKQRCDADPHFAFACATIEHLHARSDMKTLK